LSSGDLRVLGEDPRVPIRGQVRAATVSAITVVYHTGLVLWTSIASILAQSELLELIVVVNGAEKDVCARLADLAARDRRIVIVEPGRNLGFAPGCNLGARRARGSYLALVNPDCSFTEGTFAALLDVLDSRPNAWIAGGRLQHPDGREQRGGRREFLTPWRGFVEMTRLDRLFPNHPYFKRLHLFDEAVLLGPARVPVVSGAFMMMTRARFERLGGMDNRFFLHVDDSDLCLRVHLHGGEVWYAGNVPIAHHRSTSQVSRLFVEWHKTRGGCYYFKKHFGGTYPGWSLQVLSIMLWARFLVIAPKALFSGLHRRDAIAPAGLGRIPRPDQSAV
jgi:N-acetylglucosaminyl-diphospho-decaprenol L-rhamnosyltransferase